jgi:hypothetical protein
MSEKWVGFPYLKEQFYEEDFMRFFSSNYDPTKQVILLTHVGPEISGTTIFREEDVVKPIFSGTKILNRVIME